MAVDAAPVHQARLRLACDSPELAEIIVQAIQPELIDAPGGTRTELRLDGPVVEASISAPSLADLRASVNNVVRLLDAAHNVAGRVA